VRGFLVFRFDFHESLAVGVAEGVQYAAEDGCGGNREGRFVFMFYHFID
jgi:hypothetical protein